jgi:hypothetical protein
MKTFSVLLLSFCLYLNIDCSKNNESIVTDFGDNHKKSFLNNSYFPLQLGNSWIYDYNTDTEMAIVKIFIIDSLRHTDGTLLFAFKEGVVGSPTSEYGEYYYGNNNGNIWYCSAATEFIEDDLGNRIPTIKTEFLKDSLYINLEWLSYYYSYTEQDTFTVISHDSLVVNGIKFPDVYLITRDRAQGVDSIYYAEAIGMIKRVMYDMINNRKHFEYKLREYHVN